ncbi:MAG: LacI family transcriptional regulator [Arthrobacter sp.]|nr:LacI family transcriptional regulator [Arthrobacter sp.]
MWHAPGPGGGPRQGLGLDVGARGSPLAKSRYLDMSSVDYRGDIVGSDVANALLARIQDPTLEPRRKLIEPALIVRGTTARFSG